MEHVSTQDSALSNLDDFNMNLFQGETAAIVKLNDVGVDKLMEILCYNRPISSGRIYIGEQLVNRHDYSNFTRNRISIVDRNSKLISDLSVIDNIFLSPAKSTRFMIRKKQQLREFLWLCNEYGLSSVLDADSKEITIFQRCVIEILRAVVAEAKLIIISHLEEVLSKSQFAAVKKLLQQVTRHQFAVLFICFPHQYLSHSCDRCLFIHNGHDVKVTDRHNQYAMRSLLSDYISVPAPCTRERTAPPLLQVSHLYLETFYDLTFSVAAGECIGIRGREEKDFLLFLQLFQRIRRPDIGKIVFEEKDFYQCPPSPNSILIVQRDLANTMMMNELSYLDNLCIGLNLRLNTPFRSKRVLKGIKKNARETTGNLVDARSIKFLTKEQRIWLLYERLCLLHPRLVIFNCPFSENDLAIKKYIAEIINLLKGKGIGVVILTVENCDYLNVCDWILFFLILTLTV